VKGTQVADQNFGRIEVSGVMNQRVLQIEVYNTRGEKLWQKTIEAE